MARDGERWEAWDLLDAGNVDLARRLALARLEEDHLDEEAAALLAVLEARHAPARPERAPAPLGTRFLAVLYGLAGASLAITAALAAAGATMAEGLRAPQEVGMGAAGSVVFGLGLAALGVGVWRLRDAAWLAAVALHALLALFSLRTLQYDTRSGLLQLVLHLALVAYLISVGHSFRPRTRRGATLSGTRAA